MNLKQTRELHEAIQAARRTKDGRIAWLNEQHRTPAQKLAMAHALAGLIRDYRAKHRTP